MKLNALSYPLIGYQQNLYLLKQQITCVLVETRNYLCTG
jgi:hypothetical protein